MAVDEDKLNAFVGKAVGDLGAAMSAVLVLIGDELGLYSALAEGRLSAEELAKRTGTNERYVREWLANQAAGGYIEYDSGSDKFYLSEEQALCLASPNGPMDLPGGYSIVEDLFQVKQRAVENFRSGAGMEWGEHHPCLFRGTERFLGPATTRALSRTGCPHSMVSSRSSRPEGASPMWGAGTACRQF
jgi:hypothetical protein